MMNEDKINEVLLKELTKRSGEEWARFGVRSRGKIGKVGSVTIRPIFTKSYDTLHLLEKLLTSEEMFQYAMELVLEAGKTNQFSFLVSPLDRARVLAKTLRGES